MFHIMPEGARSKKGRPNCTRPALEELEPRDVPAVHAAQAVAGHPHALHTHHVRGAHHAALNHKVAVMKLAASGSTNGAAGQMPAFYDGKQFTVNMKEMPKNASASLIGHNQSINTIYASNDLDEEQDFVPVIDAIQGDGFNPLWRQVLIVFNPGFTPHQFTSEEEVLAAAAGTNPEITLNVTDEVYRCSVVGAGKNA
jgi:hypothetical protein